MGQHFGEFCLDILNGGASIRDKNTTHIVLIPKTTNPVSLQKFRPISLCSVLYKMILKTMVNRFQKVIGKKFINEAQSSFVPGRLIIGNIINAY